MSEIKWVGKHVEVAPPKKPKKISGTFFPKVLGQYPYNGNSPFVAWCRSTRTYEVPFEGNKYTNAGNVIEPKVFDFLKREYFMLGLKTPTDMYGADYFKKTWGDFFPDNKVFSGMWDAIVLDDDGNVERVIEVKTAGDETAIKQWPDGTAPHHYGLQAALYAYLLGIEDVTMVCVMLNDDNGDYEHPEQVVPTFDDGHGGKNNIVDSFRGHERYPNFDEMIEYAQEWWEKHVITGISPDFDEKADADILKVLRTNSLNPKSDIEALMQEGEALQAEVDTVTTAIDKKKKRLEAIKKQVKEHMMTQFKDGQTKVEAKGSSYVWSLSRSNSTKLDEDRLKADGLYDKYSKTEPTYRMTVSKKKED